MKYFCLSFDLEEFDLPKEYDILIKDKKSYEESFEGTKKILKLLDRLSLKATFFITSKFALKYPALIKNISKKHEIALHGYKHDSNYQKMSNSEAFEELYTAKKEIEKIISKKIYGFRAPRMMPPSFKVLKKIGIIYDSSLHPTYVPGRYNHFFDNRRIKVEEGIIQVPVSVTPLAKLPFTWLWFRNLGLNYSKLCTKLSLLGNDYVSIYFHPWEFQNLEKYRIPFYIKRNTGLILEKNLKSYLNWCLEKGFKFISISDYLKSKGILTGR